MIVDFSSITNLGFCLIKLSPAAPEGSRAAQSQKAQESLVLATIFPEPEVHPSNFACADIEVAQNRLQHNSSTSVHKNYARIRSLFLVLMSICSAGLYVRICIIKLAPKIWVRCRALASCRHVNLHQNFPQFWHLGSVKIKK